MVISHGQLARGGWSGAMNGVGFGWASVDVISSFGDFGTAITPNMTGPSASMSPTTGYAANANLPPNSSDFTVARIKGTNGYIWKANTAPSNGDWTSNVDIDGRITIQPSDCASLEIASSLSSSNGNSGTISVDAIGTAGTALLLRGFEFMGVLPPDDPGTTNVNETLEFLKTNGTLKWDILLTGPFNLTQSNCNAIVIPFTGNVSNVYFVADGEAKSNPLTITCPSNVVFTCSGPADYPPAQTSGGCGNVTVTYSPSANSLPIGMETLVTATAMDGSTNIATCTFTATRQEGLVFDGFYSPLQGLEGTDCTKVFKNSELTRIGQNIPIKFRTFCNGVNYSATAPTYEIERCSDNMIVKTNTFDFVSSAWHGQFDTGEQGITVGQYVIHVKLQDGTTRKVAVKLKR
jgi:HYR domain-containing protein